MAFLKVLGNQAFQAFRGAICSSYADKGQLFDTTCAQRDLFVNQRMNASGLLLMIYSPETKQNKMVRYLNMVTCNSITIYIQNGNYSQ
jgi:hypothetical protein